jgi:two-component system sensor histidine kinase PilS (NtrC family)
MITFLEESPILSPIRRLGLIYAAYRMVLSFFLILLFLLTVNNPIVGAFAPYLYLQSIAGYCFATLMGYAVFRHWPFQHQSQLLVMLIVDVLALSVMLYANGGPSLQMTMLYLVVVVAANILLPSVRALMVALLAVIMVVWQQFFFAITQQTDIRSIGGAILLSISFLGVSLLTRHVVKRLQDVEAVAAKQARQMRQLQIINQRIVERMQSGVLVLNQDLQVIVANQAAQALLNRQIRVGYPLHRISTQFEHLVQHAIDDGMEQLVLDSDTEGQRQTLGIYLSSLDYKDSSPMLILFIEGLERVNQQAQQLKLASLGRLTASIAHEIRNPLAAISQAAELLQDTIVDAADQELLSMICKQSQRMNHIIENVLQLSRRQKATPQTLTFDQWLHAMLHEHFAGSPHISTQLQSDLLVRFDPQQLEQVLMNLIQNGLYHAQKIQTQPHVRLIASYDEQHRVQLDVTDNGAGVNEEARKTLFEPFFTTEPQGTGLGLYLSRAFCEANGARLFHVPTPTGACFRLIFSPTTHA